MRATTNGARRPVVPSRCHAGQLEDGQEGKVTGFLEIPRRKKAAVAADCRAVARLARGEAALRRRELKEQKARWHDLLHQVLPSRRPLGNLIPDCERPGLSRSMAPRHRSAACDQQLSRGHRRCVRSRAGIVRVGINDAPVTIKAAANAIIEREFGRRLIIAQPRRPQRATGKRVAVVAFGKAPARPNSLNRAATRSPCSRARRPNRGLLRNGIPAFKLWKSWLKPPALA